jgi:hypothetical protein
MAGRALGKLPSQLLVQIALFDAQTRDADLDAVEVGACACGLVALVFLERKDEYVPGNTVTRRS